MTFTPEDWPRVKVVFDAALEVAGADRAAFVVSACGDDAELRRQVETLLAEHLRATGFLDTPACGAFEPPSDVEWIGRTIGTYRITAKLGAGGMGEVYAAHDANLDRPVALKLLPAAVAADPDRLRRFRAEARAASSLNHPHILVVRDFGEVESRSFIVTELVEGETLRTRLQRGPLSVREVVAIAVQMASALAAAHARGLVHRDLKPENVMLRPDGYVKVLDFGLAKLLASAVVDGAEPTLARTTPGLVMGTPRYMSPEQACGVDVDARSDIWSVGVMLYEMTAGRAPFTGATPVDLIAALLNSEPVPLELQAPHAPSALTRIVGRALRRDRLERYSSATELAADLAALKRLVDRDDPIMEAAADLGLTNERGVSSTPSPGVQIAKRTRLIVFPFRVLRPDPDIDFLGFSLADAIATTLSSLDSLIVRSTMIAARYAEGQPDFTKLAAEAEVDAILTGTLLRAGSQLRVTAQVIAAPQGTIVWSDRVDVPVDDVIRVQDELCHRLCDALAVPLTVREQEILARDVPVSVRAYELYLRGNSHFYDPEKWTVARDLFIECVKEDPRYAPAWARLGRCYRLTAKFASTTIEEVKENLRRADVAFRKAFDLNPDLPLAHHLYTAVETDLGRAEEALVRLVRRARQRRADPELYAGLVHACRYCGLLDASVAAHDRAKQLDPHVATSIAQTFWMRGEYERAIEGFTGFFVGLPLVSLGRDAEAVAAARASAALVRDPTTRSYQSILPLMLEGRGAECLRLLDDLSPRNPDPESVFYIARTYARLGAIDAAVSQFDRAVDMGFFCHPTFVRDPWLDPLRANAVFADAISRARRRHEDAARAFREASGERLLGLK